MDEKRKERSKLEYLRSTLKECKVINFGEYDYFIHPITDGFPRLGKRLFDEISDEIIRVGNFEECDVIIAPEAMGIPISSIVAYRLDIPITIIRKRKYGLDGEHPVNNQTGYGKSPMFINSIEKGDGVVIIDDVVSTGGTLIAIIEKLREIGADIKDIIVIIDKNYGAMTVANKFSIPIKTLVEVQMKSGQLVVK